MAIGDKRVFGWDSAAATDVGRVRRRNEDSILVRPDRLIFAVADGMGGHAAGDVASALAIASIDESFPRAPDRRLGATALSRRLLVAVAAANAAIIARAAATPAEAGMGTTLTVMAPLRSEPACVIAHVGDSRVYRIRAGGIAQLTTDHTWVQQQVVAGALSPADARTHPWSSMLTRVLGMDEPGPADILVCDVLPADVFLLCSDGLTAMLSDDEIAAIASEPLDPAALCANLIARANEAGGRDNSSVVLLRAAL